MTYSYKWRDCRVDIPPYSFSVRYAESFETASKVKERSELPFGSSLWPAALVLAEFLVEQPAAVAGKRVLELGCGVGLASLVAARLGAHVVASDGHPDMPTMLAHNSALNQLDIPYVQYDWAQPEPPGRYQVVIASDVLYEPAACTLLLDAIERCLEPGGLCLITDPGRPHVPRFLKQLQKRGFSFANQRRTLLPQTDEATMFLLRQHATAKRKHDIWQIRHAPPMP